MSFSLDPKILILFSAVAHFVLAWVIFQKSRKSGVNISFALFTFFLGVWALFFYFYFNPILFSSLIWMKIVYFVAFLIIPPILYFSFNFPERTIKSAIFLGIIYIAVAVPLIWLLFFTDLWIKEVIIYPWGPQTITGSGYVFYSIFVGISAVLLFYNFIRNYLSATGIAKTQLWYILLGIFLFGIPGIIVDVVLPIVSGTSRYFWLSPVFSLVFVIFTTYAITRYQLMDIKLVLGKGAVYSLSFLTVVGLALLFMFFTNQFLSPLDSNTILLIGISSSLLFFQLVKFYEKIAEEYFYHTFYNTKIVVAELEEKLTQVLELDVLVSLVTNTLIDTFKLRKIAISVKKIGDSIFLPNSIVGFSEKEVSSLIKDKFLIEYLEKTKKPVIREELTSLITKNNHREKDKLEIIQKQMGQMGVELLLPFIFEKKIIGIIFLGEKVSGDAFSSQDIELLTALSRSASIALKNASLYSEISDRKQELEKFYRLTVGRELQMKELKDKIEELEGKLKEKD